MAHVIDAKWRSVDVKIEEEIEFSGLMLSERILIGLKKSGFVRPSPIQLQAIPLGRCGLDLIVQAKSGTGKTCVFTVIALEGLLLQADVAQVLVLVPTREIALQVCEVITSIGSGFKELVCQSFIGGTSVEEDKDKLKKCHVVVGTPGRIKHLISMGALKTNSIRMFILDEADKLLEPTFLDCLNSIYAKLPEHKQVLALSATYPEALENLLKSYMRDPFYVRLNVDRPALLGIQQFYTSCTSHVLPQISFKHKTDTLIRILRSISFSQCLVFSNLQTKAEGLCDLLNKAGWATSFIGGGLHQGERIAAMSQLKAFKCRILVSTDVTSRGIDAENINLVINLDVPHNVSTYLHRIGRAGRFGSEGLAITIVSGSKEKEHFKHICQEGHLDIRPMPDPFPSDLWTYLMKGEDLINKSSCIVEEVKPKEVLEPPALETLDLSWIQAEEAPRPIPSFQQLLQNYQKASLEEKSKDTEEIVEITEMPDQEKTSNIGAYLVYQREILKREIKNSGNLPHTKALSQNVKEDCSQIMESMVKVKNFKEENEVKGKEFKTLQPNKKGNGCREYQPLQPNNEKNEDNDLKTQKLNKEENEGKEFKPLIPNKISSGGVPIEVSRILKSTLNPLWQSNAYYRANYNYSNLLKNQWKPK